MNHMPRAIKPSTSELAGSLNIIDLGDFKFFVTLALVSADSPLVVSLSGSLWTRLSTLPGIPEPPAFQTHSRR